LGINMLHRGGMFVALFLLRGLYAMERMIGEMARLG
jgi:hypothetical protein